jgi:hypothetical protein
LIFSKEFDHFSPGSNLTPLHRATAYSRVRADVELPSLSIQVLDLSDFCGAEFVEK